MSRRILIAAGVVLLHLGLLWALQSGLMYRAFEVVVPAEVVSELITPPTPRTEPPPSELARTKPAPPPPPVAMPPSMPLIPTPTQSTVAVASASPVVATPAAAAPSPRSVPTAPTPPAPAKIELPSTNATYLNNPKPPYPPLSKRLGEEGQVVVRVLIGVDGTAQQAEIRTSSGYDRLDQAALATVRSWRYVPGKRGGVPEAMWFNVPISFVLE